MVDPFLYDGRDPLWWNKEYNEQIWDIVAQGKKFIIGGAVSRERYIDTIKEDGGTSMRFKVEIVPLVMTISASAWAG